MTYKNSKVIILSIFTVNALVQTVPTICTARENIIRIKSSTTILYFFGMEHNRGNKDNNKRRKPSSYDKSYNYALLLLHSFQSRTCKDEEISSKPPKVLNLKR